MIMADWLTVNSPALADLWPGNVDIDQDALEIILEAAATQCEIYLADRWDPVLEDLPATWAYAQVLQAKALSTSGIAGRDDETGGFGDTVTVFPMDWTVKNLLRPKGGISIA